MQLADSASTGSLEHWGSVHLPNEFPTFTLILQFSFLFVLYQLLISISAAIAANCATMSTYYWPLVLCR